MKRRKADVQAYESVKRNSDLDFDGIDREGTAFDAIRRQGARLLCCVRSRKANSKARSWNERASTLPRLHEQHGQPDHFSRKQSPLFTNQSVLQLPARQYSGHESIRPESGRLTLGKYQGYSYDDRQPANGLHSGKNNLGGLHDIAQQDEADCGVKWAALKGELKALQLAMLAEKRSSLDSDSVPEKSKTMQIMRELDDKVIEYEEARKRANSSLQRLLNERQESVVTKTPLVPFPVATASQPPPSPSRGDAEELRDRYFDRLGDINVFQERRAELVYNHQQKFVKRELQHDQDLKLKLTDEEFEARHQARLQEIEAQVAEATVDVEKLRTQCLERGLDIEPRRRESLSDSSVASDDDDIVAPGTSHSFGPPTPSQHRNLLLEQWRQAVDVTADAQDSAQQSARSSCEDLARRGPSASGAPSNVHETP